jgi:cardiolipin synthase C
VTKTRRGRVLRGVAMCVAAAWVALAVVAATSNLPSLENRNASTALPDTRDTRLGRAVVELAAGRARVSGIYALTDGREAFAARSRLADVAERSLDVQYYIWRRDMSGTLLFDSLLRAAQRGVRVRLLLDDNNTRGLDATLAALDAHPNVEVRLFNPFVIRGARLLGYLTDFSRLNRRIHNKSFTADNQVTIIGGRNIGDEYFDASSGVTFIDVDVMAIGPVVNDVSHDFDRYWASESSYPLDRLLEPPDIGAGDLHVAAAQIAREPAAAAYLQAMRDSSFVRDLIAHTLPVEWAATRMVSDDPAKGLGRASPAANLPAQLQAILREPTLELQLISPYFVPTAAGVEWFTAIAGRGVNVKVLTNSLEATDVAAVHAGYAMWREPLLAAGVTLYEARRQPADVPVRERAGLSGSSASSLHAKAFAVDGSRVFVGSFNFDPRSVELNTEMGFVIDSPALASRVAAAFTDRIPMRAYEVRLSDAGDFYWVERQGERVRRHDTEPGTTFWQRAGVTVLSVLPVEWLL